MMNIKAKRDIAHKTKILNHARESKNIARICRHFGTSREIFYIWKRVYERDGEKGLTNNTVFLTLGINIEGQINVE